MKQYDRICAYIDLDALHSNLNAMKNNMKPGVKMMGVIKTDGYGHGAVPIAWEMEPLDYVYGFATATVEEAVQLRKEGIKKPVLILGYSFPYSYPLLAEYNITPSVFKLQTLKLLNSTGKERGIRIPVQIKVDTGMSRIGIFPDDQGLHFVKQALSCENLEVTGIFTHFARADETDKSFSNHQHQIFMDFVHRCEKELSYTFPCVHCSNSPGIIDMPYANEDMVRAGISLYGLWPSAEVSRTAVPLKPILTLKSHITYIKELDKGTPVSYGGTYITSKKTRVATIPAGYGDGYPRTLSNAGSVIIHGKKVPVIGRICMDQFMVDVSECSCSEGDEVTLIGTDGDCSITMEELGDLSGRFNYELACDLGKRIPRVYLKNGKAVYVKDYNEDVKVQILS